MPMDYTTKTYQMDERMKKRERKKVIISIPIAISKSCRSFKTLPKNIKVDEETKEGRVK